MQTGLGCIRRNDVLHLPKKHCSYIIPRNEAKNKASRFSRKLDQVMVQPRVESHCCQCAVWSSSNLIEYDNGSTIKLIGDPKWPLMQRALAQLIFDLINYKLCENFHTTTNQLLPLIQTFPFIRCLSLTIIYKWQFPIKINLLYVPWKRFWRLLSLFPLRIIT